MKKKAIVSATVLVAAVAALDSSNAVSSGAQAKDANFAESLKAKLEKTVDVKTVPVYQASLGTQRGGGH